MKILAIDTSCDDTAVAVTDGDKILSNKIASQIELHKKWGGVVPDVARNAHRENIDLVIKEALQQVKLKNTGNKTDSAMAGFAPLEMENIDAFAVTYGPGLAIALGVGIDKAKELAKNYKKPLIAVNHMEGHIYSALAKNSAGNPEVKYAFPLVALLVSGGHTEIVLMRDHGVYEILGRTLDDAVGEAFDKVARMLSLGYPGGAIVERMAREGDPDRFPLPLPMAKIKSGDFSYSGLKTAVLYLTRKVLEGNINPKEKKQIICDIAASFQKTAIEHLLNKTEFVLDTKVKYQGETLVLYKDLILAGGVAANKVLRREFRKRFGRRYRIHFPTDKKLYGDNAGMIGVAAYYKALRESAGWRIADPDTLERAPNLSL